MSKERNVFGMLWKMYHELRKEDEALEYGDRLRDNKGTIISRYAGIIDDRILNSGHSRNTDTLKLFTTEQLQAELDERKRTKE